MKHAPGPSNTFGRFCGRELQITLLRSLPGKRESEVRLLGPRFQGDERSVE